MKGFQSGQQAAEATQLRFSAWVDLAFSKSINFGSTLRNALTATTMAEIADRVKTIIVDKLGVDQKEVSDEASFTNDLGADSLDQVELIMEFEKEFNLSIPDEAAEKINTVGDAINYLTEHAS